MAYWCENPLRRIGTRLVGVVFAAGALSWACAAKPIQVATGPTCHDC